MSTFITDVRFLTETVFRNISYLPYIGEISLPFNLPLSDRKDESVRALQLASFLCCHFIKFSTMVFCFTSIRHSTYSCQMAFCKKYQSNLRLLFMKKLHEGKHAKSVTTKFITEFQVWLCLLSMISSTTHITVFLARLVT